MKAENIGNEFSELKKNWRDWAAQRIADIPEPKLGTKAELAAWCHAIDAAVKVVNSGDDHAPDVLQQCELCHNEYSLLDVEMTDSGQILCKKCRRRDA